MKPVTRTREQELQVFEEILKEGTKSLNEKLENIETAVKSSRSMSREEKIEDVIRKMKNKIPERVVMQQETKEEIKIPKKEITVKETNVKEKIEEIIEKKESEHIHDDVFCPTCNKGHVHKLDNSGLTMQCTDGNCKEKFFMIPESADYQCSTCGLPLKKPANDKTLDACPFCGNEKLAIPINNGKPSLKFDFSKMRK